MLLPPQVLLILGAHGGQQVVRVHDDVNEGVEHSEERSVATGREFDTPPNGGRHDAVVNHMQIGDLVKLFTQNEKDGVQELGEFAEIIPPTHVNHNQFVGIVGIVNRLAAETVTEQPRVHQTLRERRQTGLLDPTKIFLKKTLTSSNSEESMSSNCEQSNYLVHNINAGYNLKDVVNDDGPSEFKGLAIAHQSRSQRFHKVNVTRADNQSRKWRTHQQPSVHPRICRTRGKFG